MLAVRRVQSPRSNHVIRTCAAVANEPSSVTETHSVAYFGKKSAEKDHLPRSRWHFHYGEKRGGHENKLIEIILWFIRVNPIGIEITIPQWEPVLSFRM